MQLIFTLVECDLEARPEYLESTLVSVDIARCRRKKYRFNTCNLHKRTKRPCRWRLASVTIVVRWTKCFTGMLHRRCTLLMGRFRPCQLRPEVKGHSPFLPLSAGTALDLHQANNVDLTIRRKRDNGGRDFNLVEWPDRTANESCMRRVIGFDGYFSFLFSFFFF